MFKRRYRSVGPRAELRSARVGHENTVATIKAGQQKEIMDMQRAMTESLKSQTAMANVLVEKLDRMR